MSGQALCNKCGGIIHWYQASGGRTHPPLDRIDHTVYIVNDQEVYKRPGYILHRCSPLQQEIYQQYLVLNPGKINPLSKAAADGVEIRRWFMQVWIDQAETYHCHKCHATPGQPCENLNWALGHHGASRFTLEPHKERLEDVDPTEEPCFDGPFSFRYQVPSTAEEVVYSIDAFHPSLRPQR